MARMHFTESLIGLVYPPSNDANLLLTFTVYNLKYSKIEKELFYFFYFLFSAYDYLPIFPSYWLSNTLISNLLGFLSLAA
jgi:hypothetical protein